MEVRIEVPTKDDLDYLARNLRQSDVDEVYAATGVRDMRFAVKASVAVSEESLVGRVDGVPVCVWGVQAGSLITRHGIPWLVGTDAVSTYQRAFLRRNKKWVERVRQDYSYLMNFVDVRNDKAIKWLEWLGFAILPAAPFGPFDMMFHRFAMQGEG